MDIQIPLIPTSAPSPINLNAYIEVAVPDGASATGYTTCKVLLSSLGLTPGKKYAANMKQSLASATPTLTYLVNSTGVVPTISRTGTGVYKLTFIGLFSDSNKLQMPPLLNGEDGCFTLIPIKKSTAAILGYYAVYYNDVDSLLIKVFDSSFAAIDLYDLTAENTNLPINFTIYP